MQMKEVMHEIQNPNGWVKVLVNRRNSVYRYRWYFHRSVDASEAENPPNYFHY